ncbi:hypothetical protein GCM10009425_46870 [Pseudomonas asuensis]|uniref:Conjugal transfer protein TraD n=1 Tax=Pseudomonas asuensis TaxID=1825787 RepID=A0ABQ2H5B1_9PSED|nr:conjugal transfer protein TraD [Pseudomonas asuensis]GGM30867.1 hypothetical protein GCM10009425_46870 [Pseudomonas asuensis]
MRSEWLDSRIAYIEGLKSPTDSQRLLVMLARKNDRSTEEARKLALLVRAEKAEVRAQKAKADVARVMNAEKLKARKARDRELYNSAGLLILSGLVDTKTGRPVMDRGELLGMLIQIHRGQFSESQRADFKKTGDALLAAKGT